MTLQYMRCEHANLVQCEASLPKGKTQTNDEQQQIESENLFNDLNLGELVLKLPQIPPLPQESTPEMTVTKLWKKFTIASPPPKKKKNASNFAIPKLAHCKVILYALVSLTNSMYVRSLLPVT